MTQFERDEADEPNPARPALGEEAAKLLAGVQEWARRTFPEPEGGHSSECQWCPLCQLMALVRGDRPEVADRLAEAGNAMAAAVRALLESADRPSPRPGPQPTPDTGPRPRVQRIDLGNHE